MEIGAYPGNSGSPVFYYSPRDLDSKVAQITISGLVSGGYLDPYRVINASGKSLLVENQECIMQITNGIAVVEPAIKIYEILFSDELKKFRGYYNDPLKEWLGLNKN